MPGRLEAEQDPERRCSATRITRLERGRNHTFPIENTDVEYSCACRWYASDVLVHIDARRLGFLRAHHGSRDDDGGECEDEEMFHASERRCAR
jgi:hypothetical protein